MTRTPVRFAAAACSLALLVAGCSSDPAPAPAPSASSAAAGDACPASKATAKQEFKQFPAAPDPAKAAGKTKATITTSCGTIELELYPDKAPKAVSSFAMLAGEKYFDQTICHRLTTEGIFVLQCGDPSATGRGGPGYYFGPVENAPAENNYPAGTLAMARRGRDANSNGSQFFLVYQDSQIPSDMAGGYTVFGRITGGMDVLKKIAKPGVGANGVAPAIPVSLDKVEVP